MSTFWNFTRDDDTGNGTIQLDGEIVTENDWWSSGGQVVARSFRNRLATCKDITVYINSPGGDVFAGAELYTALRERHAGQGDGEGDRHRGKRSFAGGDGRG